MLITVHVYIWIYSANKTDSVKVKTAQLAPPAARAHANPAQFPVRTVGFRTILNLFRQLASYYWVFVSPISTKTKCSCTVFSLFLLFLLQKKARFVTVPDEIIGF
jgi:hypothetical protein